ncbi:hypothetical protein PUNSTDRAFT_140692 [Punctularia strigosozonata HHB-11173 SS5]|uniref:uncharacterized protein n=1 Tax=Punctularia strigosozonata (strain HHB-11173) TaxID=741275 RepID=UPI00044182DF|nr:uncharacterized protein PUNSTDRAFT_140692 [Punctularia strigosozonata HHB-11173 SS5]EIN14390.1 hypothetical protein PUNSTDRAFT_140692 [Punctularia strigosozonata HHB-11173 SS5]
MEATTSGSPESDPSSPPKPFLSRKATSGSASPPPPTPRPLYHSETCTPLRSPHSPYALPMLAASPIQHVSGLDRLLTSPPFADTSFDHCPSLSFLWPHHHRRRPDPESPMSTPALDSPSTSASASPYLMDITEPYGLPSASEPRPKLTLDTATLATIPANSAGAYHLGPSFDANTSSGPEPAPLTSPASASALSTDGSQYYYAQQEIAPGPSSWSSSLIIPPPNRTMSAGASTSKHACLYACQPTAAFLPPACGAARSPTHIYHRRAAAAPYSAVASPHRQRIPFFYPAPDLAAGQGRTHLVSHRRPHPQAPYRVSLPATVLPPPSHIYRATKTATAAPSQLLSYAAPTSHHSLSNILPTSTSAPPIPVPSAYYAPTALPYPIEQKPLVLHQPKPVRPIPPIVIPDPTEEPPRKLPPPPPAEVESDFVDDDMEEELDWEVEASGDAEDVGHGELAATHFGYGNRIERPESIPLLCQPLPGYRG